MSGRASGSKPAFKMPRVRALMRCERDIGALQAQKMARCYVDALCATMLSRATARRMPANGMAVDAAYVAMSSSLQRRACEMSAFTPRAFDAMTVFDLPDTFQSLLSPTVARATPRLINTVIIYVATLSALRDTWRRYARCVACRARAI